MSLIEHIPFKYIQLEKAEHEKIGNPTPQLLCMLESELRKYLVIDVDQVHEPNSLKTLKDVKKYAVRQFLGMFNSNRYVEEEGYVLHKTKKGDFYTGVIQSLWWACCGDAHRKYNKKKKRQQKKKNAAQVKLTREKSSVQTYKQIKYNAKSIPAILELLQLEQEEHKKTSGKGSRLLSMLENGLKKFDAATSVVIALPHPFKQAHARAATMK